MQWFIKKNILDDNGTTVKNALRSIMDNNCSKEDFIKNQAIFEQYYNGEVDIRQYQIWFECYDMLKDKNIYTDYPNASIAGKTVNTNKINIDEKLKTMLKIKIECQQIVNTKARRYGIGDTKTTNMLKRIKDLLTTQPENNALPNTSQNTKTNNVPRKRG